MLQGVESRGLYRLDFRLFSCVQTNKGPGSSFEVSNVLCQYASVIDPSMLWHMGLGHSSFKVLSCMFRQSGIQWSSTYGLCSACYVGKSIRLPFFDSTKCVMLLYNC